MEQLIHFLKELGPISNGLETHLIETLKFKTYHKNDYLLKAGQQGNTISFLFKGLVRCYYDKDEKEVTRWLLKEGDVIISLKSFYLGFPSMEYIQALEETSVGYIKREELDFIYEAYPEFNVHGRKLAVHYQLLWDEIIFANVKKSAEERYLWLLRDHPQLIQRVAGKYLASYLGLDETTFSKIKKTIQLNNSA